MLAQWNLNPPCLPFHHGCLRSYKVGRLRSWTVTEERSLRELVPVREKDLGLVGEGLGLGEAVGLDELLELLQGRALLAVEVRGDFEDDVRLEVAGRSAAEARNALAAEPEDLAVRSARGQLELRGSLGRGDVDFAAERRENRGDGDLDREVESVPLEDVAFADADEHIEVAVLAAAESAGPLPRKAETRAVVDAGRDLEVDLAALGDVSGAAARAARLLDGGAFAAAGRAGLADLEESAAADDDAGTAAVPALLGEREVDRAGRAEEGLVEVDVEAEGHVVAALRRVRIGAPLLASAASEEIAEAAEARPAAAAVSAENVSEHGEDVLHVHAAGPAEASGAGSALERLMAELVVTLALVGVMENVIRLGRFLELLLGDLVAGIAVGMVLHRELAIGGLDLVRRRRLRNTQDVVIIAFVSHLPYLSLRQPARRGEAFP